MEPRTAPGSTELRYCTASGDEVVTIMADVDVDVAAVVEGSPVRDSLSWT